MNQTSSPWAAGRLRRLGPLLRESRVAFSWAVTSLVFGCALAIAAFALSATQSLAALNDGTDHATRALGGRYALAEVQQHFMELGAGARRFAGTHDPESFADAQAAAKVLPGSLAQLRAALASDPAQAPRLTELAALAERRLALSRRFFALAANDDYPGVQALVASGEGARLTSAAKELIAAMQARQNERWERAIAEAEEARVRVAGSIVGLAALAVGLLVLVAVITMRHNTRAWRAQEELATTLRSIADAVISTDLQGHVRFMNSSAERLTGWRNADAQRRPLSQVLKILDGTTEGAGEDLVARVLRENAAVVGAADARLVGAAGREYAIENSAAPIRGASDEPVGVVLVFRDTTSLRAQQRELQQSAADLRAANATLESRIAERTAQLLSRENLIRTFYEHSTECHAILERTPDGSFRYEEINPATLQLYHKSRGEVIGRKVHEVLDDDTASTLTHYLEECLRLGVPLRYERQQGEVSIEAVASAIPPQPDAPRAVVVSARDVTERRRLQQQLLQSQKMEAVGQLTGGLAHDFNNLLTAISGSLELVQLRLSQGRGSDVAGYLSAAQGAAKRAAAVTHRLLAFSRRQTLVDRPTDVNRLVSDMIDLLERTVGPETHIETRCAPGLWTPSVDANQLENALLNLCINARDAMPEGGRIVIETGNQWVDEAMAQVQDLAPGQYVALSVTDTGYGMSPDIMAHAFEPFFTTKPLGQGTGLGLSMIYGFARQSGGQVRIQSELGRGASICILLPRFTGLDTTARPLRALIPPPGATRDGETVLVVDDEPVVRLFMSETLEDLGYRTIACADGIEALKILESARRVDLLLTDVGLPNGMNGRQLADAGRASRPDLKVLFVTGYAENAVFAQGRVGPGMEVLTKPFDMESLASRMASLMKVPER